MNSMKANKKSIKCRIFHTECGRYLYAAVFVAALMAVVYQVMPLLFETNDDSGMMYWLAGYRTGEPEIGTLFSNIVWDYIVSGLYQLCSSFPWYAIAFLFVLFISNVSIFKSILKMCARYNLEMWRATLCYIVFFAIFQVYSFVFLQFSVVSAIAGTAAIFLFYNISRNDTKSKKVVDLLLSSLFIFLSFIIREKIGLILIAFCLVVWFVKVFLEKDIKKQIFRQAMFFIGAIAILCGSAKLANTSFYNKAEWQVYKEFNSERSKYMDYAHLSYDEAEEAFEQIGWNRELYDLVNSWFLIDKKIDKEAFYKLNTVNREHSKEGGLNFKISETKNVFVHLCVYNPVVVLEIGVLVLGLLFSIITCKQYSGIVKYLIALTPISVMAAIVLFLCFQGRIPFRIFQAVAIPCAAMSLCNILVMGNIKIGQNDGLKKLVSAILLMAIAGTMVVCLKYNYKSVSESSWNNTQNMKENVENYSIEHKENIYIYDLNMTNMFSTDPLLVYDDEIPNNLFSWGGTPVRSPLYQKWIQSVGMDELYADAFFDENVYLVSTGTDSAEQLKTYLSDTYDEKVLYKVADKQNEFCIIQFYYK